METIVEENEPRTPQTHAVAHPQGRQGSLSDRGTGRVQSAVQKQQRREDTRASLTSSRSEALSRQESRMSRAMTFFEGGEEEASDVSEAESVQSLSSQLREYVDQSARDRPKQQNYARPDGKKNDLLLDSIHDVMGETDLATLQIKIARAARALVDAKRVSLYLVHSKKLHHLDSFVFHATEKDLSEKVSDFLDRNKLFSLSFKLGIPGHVARTHRPVNMGSAREHSSFSIEVDQTGQSTTGSILCMPISDTDGQLVGVIEMMNKTTKAKFGQEDDELMRKFLKYSAKAILHTRIFQTAVNAYGIKNGLYRFSQDLVRCQGDPEKAVHVFLSGMQKFIPCERYYLFVLQRGKGEGGRDIGLEIAFEEIYCGKGNPELVIRKHTNLEFVSWRATEIAKYISTEKGMLALTEENLASATGDESLTDKEGFCCKTLLCIPIFDTDETVHSVIQMANRIGGPNFSDADMRIAHDVTDAGGFALRKEDKGSGKSEEAFMRGQYILEKLAFHKSGGKDQLSRTLNSRLLKPQQIGLYDFDFNESNLSDENLLLAVLTMFNEHELTKKLGIHHDMLSRFAISVMMSYRPLPYHNWRHAVCATQFMFALLYRAGFHSYFDSQEILVLLCACLCHDIDHRGMIDVPGNGPDVFVNAPLVLIYNSATKLHQHASRALLLICSKGNNIFQSLSFERYRAAVNLLQYAINSTDMALCQAKVGKMQNLLSTGKLSKKDYHTKQLVISLLMQACDQNASTKSWGTHRKVARLAVSELTENGGIGTLRLVDIERDLGQMQFQYLDVVSTPLFAVLSALSGKLNAVERRLEQNKIQWKSNAGRVGSMDMSTDDISFHFSESSRSNSQKSNASSTTDRSQRHKSMSISSSTTSGYSSKADSKRSSAVSSRAKTTAPPKRTTSSSTRASNQTSQACVIL